tara:strand:+ start:604 stop:861 length:258 start_codon:yes stop_codon:yes gene_type:complete
MDATFLDIKQDADSRHTSVELMSIIYAMGTDLDDIHRLWQEPNPIETETIIRAVTALVDSQHTIWDGDTLHWGECTLNVSTGEIS